MNNNNYKIPAKQQNDDKKPLLVLELNLINF